MQRIKWIKVYLTFTDEIKIKNMLKGKDGDAYFALLIRLKLLAASIDDDGLIYVDKDAVLTLDDLQTYFDRPKALIEKALQLFVKKDLITIGEKNHIQMLSWEEDQSMDKLEKNREQIRRRVAKHRAKKKAEQANENETASDELPEEPLQSIEPVTTSVRDTSFDQNKATAFYKATIGPLEPKALIEIRKMEMAYGTEMVCSAIAITKERGATGFYYVKGILESEIGYAAN